MAAPGPAASPLKQVNQAGHAPRGKLAQSWDDLAHNPALFTTSADPSSCPPDRYFNEFFCLKPSLQAQSHALAALSSADLVGPYKVLPLRSSPLPKVELTSVSPPSLLSAPSE